MLLASIYQVNNTSYSVIVKLPSVGIQNTNDWYKMYHSKVLEVPQYGIGCTIVWYKVYQTMEFLGTYIHLINNKVYKISLQTYFLYLCCLYQ